VLEQSVSNLRLLIIDDASSDNSLSVAEKLAQSDARVSIISHSKNQGHINTYNEGIEWASADYFLLLSADDLLVPGALERAAAIMDQHPDIALTHGQAIVWQDDLPFPKIDVDQNCTWARQDLIQEMCARNYNIVYTATAVARTRVQKAIGGYRPSLPHSGDWEMWLRFAAHGGIASINAVQGIYRKHSANMSDGYYGVTLLHYQQRKQAFDAFFDEYSDRVPGSHSFRARADRILSETVYWNGISELCRGRVSAGLQLLRFSVGLRPELRYRPPVGYLLKRMLSLGHRALSILLRVVASPIRLL
jgi:hypothetical protein